MSDEGDGSTKLRNSDGKELDDDEQKNAIKQAKIEMVTRQQRFMEEMLLMGVNRMVVDSGKVKASLNFHIQAKENITTKDTGKNTDNSNDTTKKTLGISGQSIFAPFFSVISPSGNYEDNNVQTHVKITTNNSDSNSTTDATTNLQGEVEINFKSDYFKLDNFKEILQPSGQRSQSQKSLGASNAGNQAPEPAAVSNTDSNNGGS